MSAGVDGLSREERLTAIKHEIRDVLNVMAGSGELPVAADERGWVGRVRAAWVIVNQPGGLAVLILVFACAVYTGYLPSPLTAMADRLDSHDATVQKITEARQEIDKQFIAAIARLTDELSRRNRRDALRECDAIRDSELRRRCLE